MYYLPGELEVNLTNCKNADLEIFTLLISGNQEINFNFESLTRVTNDLISNHPS